jgi:glycosyltransferase involved in cell wall biosynthesis
LKGIVGRWGIDEKNIEVIYNGFKPPEVCEDKNRLRLSLHLEGKILVSAGRLVPWKGFRELIEAMPDILSHYPDTKLYIAGDGPDKEYLMLLVQEKKLGKNVKLLGKLPQEKLFEYVRAAHVFALYTGYEGFSHQILETMSLGTPIVTTRVGGNPEIVTDGVEGLLVSYGDTGMLSQAILKLLHNENFKRKLATAAQEKAFVFTDERMVDRTATFINSIVK